MVGWLDRNLVGRGIKVVLLDALPSPACPDGNLTLADIVVECLNLEIEEVKLSTHLRLAIISATVSLSTIPLPLDLDLDPDIVLLNVVPSISDATPPPRDTLVVRAVARV